VKLPEIPEIPAAATIHRPDFQPCKTARMASSLAVGDHRVLMLVTRRAPAQQPQDIRTRVPELVPHQVHADADRGGLPTGQVPERFPEPAASIHQGTPPRPSIATTGRENANIGKKKSLPPVFNNPMQM